MSNSEANVLTRRIGWQLRNSAVGVAAMSAAFTVRSERSLCAGSLTSVNFHETMFIIATWEAPNYGLE